MQLLYLTTDPGVPVLGHKGASVHVRAMTSAFVEAGVATTVASPRVAFEGERLGSRAGLRELSPVLPKRYSDTRALRAAIERQAEEIAELAVEIGADALYERLALFSNGGVRAAEALGLPHLLEVNAPLTSEAARFRTLPHPEVAAELELDVLSRTDRVLAVSHTLARLLVEQGVDRSRVQVVPNGVSAAVVGALARRRAQSFTMGFAGSLKPWHGVDVLLRAFEAALRHEPSLQLEIVGSGPLAEAVRTSGLPAGSLRVHGQLTHDETLATIAGWDVGVAPYPALENFYFSPLKVGEYMACGACPVVSDLPVLRELLGDGERGVLVEPGDSGSLAAAFVELARDRDRAAALGDRAREHALALLDWRGNAATALDALAALRGAIV